MTLVVVVTPTADGVVVHLSPEACTLTRATLEPLRQVLRPEFFEVFSRQALD